MSSCWGAPRTEGVPAFAPGTGARRQLAALLGVAEEALPRLPWPRGVWSCPVEAGALAWVRHVTARSADAEEMRADLAALGLVAG